MPRLAPNTQMPDFFLVYAGASGVNVQTSTPSIAQMVGSAAQTAATVMAMSDVRLKTDIEPVGTINGRNWYRYRYLWDDPGVIQHGVMAQEIARTDPEAVSVHSSGYLMVDYGRLN